MKRRPLQHQELTPATTVRFRVSGYNTCFRRSGRTAGARDMKHCVPNSSNLDMCDMFVVKIKSMSPANQKPHPDHKAERNIVP